jgi:phage terminase large subunit-like protein
MVKYEDWAKAGWLKLVDGDAIRPDVLLADICEIVRQFDVRMFAYDPWHAALLVDALKASADFPQDYCWPFKQGIANFAFPTALCERLVMQGMMHHDGNPITEWEVGHVQVKSDASGNMRPVKPPRQDRKKIDGVVATIMALDAATRMVASSVYEHRGVLVI